MAPWAGKSEGRIYAFVLSEQLSRGGRMRRELTCDERLSRSRQLVSLRFRPARDRTQRVRSAVVVATVLPSSVANATSHVKEIYLLLVAVAKENQLEPPCLVICKLEFVTSLWCLFQMLQYPPPCYHETPLFACKEMKICDITST